MTASQPPMWSNFSYVCPFYSQRTDNTRVAPTSIIASVNIAGRSGPGASKFHTRILACLENNDLLPISMSATSPTRQLMGPRMHSALHQLRTRERQLFHARNNELAVEKIAEIVRRRFCSVHTTNTYRTLEPTTNF